MAKVRSRDTKPEVLVRKLAFSLGFRFRTNVKDLPGKPDIAIKSRKKAVFIHGCFWHRHKGCRMASFPASNVEYWTEKFAYNTARDRKHMASYKQMG
jgi:DNA mismatch endonuclease, patch repair protein